MDIPEDRTFVANYTFQISIAIFSTHILRGAYETLIIADKRIKIYVYASIAYAAAKLL